MPVTRQTSAIMAGTVAHFASSTAPSGWIKANGAAVSRSLYAALFNAIGTAYGVGDGSTTFNVPDLRGEFLRGLDDGRGVDTGRTIGTNQVQAGRAITSSSGTLNTLGTTNIYQVYTPANQYSKADWSETEIRPRNTALLACIKY